jgi:hypothetical protein
MDYINAAGKWIMETSFSALQSLNSNSEQAKQSLQAEGKQVLVNYKANKDVGADKIKNVILSILQPIQTLEVTGMTATIGLYLVSHVVPWPLDWLTKAGTIASAYFTYQVWEAKSAILEEFFYFEKRGVEVIDQDKFLTHADNMADRVLARSSLFRIITSSEKTKKFRDMKEIVREMIEESNDDRGLAAVVNKVSFISTLFQFANEVEKSVDKKF